MAYTPEPTHPLQVNDEGTDHNLTAQLQREFENIRNALIQTNDILTRAVPWKAFNMILLGQGGAIGGLLNPTLPIITDSYNIDRTVNGGAGLVRTGHGVYVFTTLISVVGGVEILPILYPDFVVLIGGSNNTVDNEASVRILLTDADTASGTFEITVEQLVTPPSGKGEWEPYDLRDTTGQTPDIGETVGQDKLWASGLLSLGGEAADFGGSP